MYCIRLRLILIGEMRCSTIFHKIQKKGDFLKKKADSETFIEPDIISPRELVNTQCIRIANLSDQLAFINILH